MSESVFPKRTSITWDETHVKSLLFEPESLLNEEPWGTWIKTQGGLTAVYNACRGLPLADKQRKTLNALLNEPGASLQKYALGLHVSVATFVRYRTSLVKTLVTVLNAHLLDKHPQREESSETTPAFHTNLPYQHVPLIGREEELNAVRRLLQEGADLLTITGPGGIGKTRLSLQIAANSVRDFEHGVFFVSLASIVNPDLVVISITQALGLKTGESQPTLALLKTHLQDKHILLVLDNFEQVTAAAPLLGELLAAAPHLKILVTSRAVLHLYGEHEFNVPPLAVPDLNDLPSPQELIKFPAVALFVSRAQAVKFDFKLTAENARTIAEICVRLEGIPLALELAAARVKLFEPGALLAALNHRLTLAMQKSADRTPRHQTLRNAVAWSYQLLEPQEKSLFAQLGVFAGGCTLEAAQAVCVREDDSEAPMLEGLASLVDKSMLQHKRRENGEPRFVMLEVLREYALEELKTAGQTEDARHRHGAYYLGLVEAIEPGPREPDLPAWMKQLEEEHDNIRAALAWAIEVNEVDTALRIAGAVWKLWQIHGHVEEGIQWTTLILARSEGQVSLARAKVLWGAGWLGMVTGNLAQSRKYFEEGAAISRKLKDNRYLGLALHGIGAVARGQGDFPSARAAFDESVPLFQALGNAEDIAWTYEHLGATAIEQGDFDEGISYLSQALVRFQELRQNWACAEALTFLGHAALQQRNYTLAQSRYEEALSIYQELEDRPNVATMNSYVGATLFGRGDHQRAVSLYKESLLLARDFKDYWGVTWGVERLAEVAEKLGQLERAARLWGAADSLRNVSGVSWHPGFHSYYTDQRFASLKDELGEARWEQLWAEGQSTGLNEIVEHALEI